MQGLNQIEKSAKTANHYVLERISMLDWLEQLPFSF